MDRYLDMAISHGPESPFFPAYRNRKQLWIILNPKLTPELLQTPGGGTVQPKAGRGLSRSNQAAAGTKSAPKIT
jgi:hypothetical protein